MEQNTFVLSGLKTKRDELFRDLRAAEKRVAVINAQIVALDATTRLFDPDAKLPAIGPGPSGAGRRTGLSTAIRTVLRQSASPLSARQIAEAIAVPMKVDANNSKEMTFLTARVRGGLRRMRGLVTERRIEGNNLSGRTLPVTAPIDGH